jgi:hypothetical protein
MTASIEQIRKLFGVGWNTVMRAVTAAGELVAAIRPPRVDIVETESAKNNLIKRIKRIADLGMANFTHWRIRVLLYAGKPEWSRLSMVTTWPRRNSEERHRLRQSRSPIGKDVIL